MSPIWKAGIRLAILNLILIVAFFASMFGAKLGNELLFKNTGRMLPIVPLVFLLFVLISLGTWFLAGKKLTLLRKERLMSALIGTLPIVIGLLGSIALLVFNALFISGTVAAATLVPFLLIVVAFATISTFVGTILLTQSQV